MSRVVKKNDCFKRFGYYRNATKQVEQTFGFYKNLPKHQKKIIAERY